MNTIPELIAAIKSGQMIVMLDDEDRENEGDLIMAASAVRAQDINFMATHARGLICMPMSHADCQRLQLPLMVGDNRNRYRTNFTISIEAARGITTGISAHDRAATVRMAADPNSKPSDLLRPGHIFPLMARPEGVLERAGHTEAAVDLTRLAGAGSTAVLVEILNHDGTMARRPQLEVFASEHDLMIGTIADLIQWREQHEKPQEKQA